MNNKSASKQSTADTSFLARVFGKMNWVSPPWLTSFRAKANAHPLVYWGGSVLVLLLMTVVIGGYYWYKNQPKPQLITAVITVPQITPIAETMVPNNLVLDFGYKTDELMPQSVAPLDRINQDVTSAVTMQPALAGTWIWENDSRLVFTPETDWPAGQTYTITFAKNFFADSKKMQSMTYSFATQPFEANIKQFSLYQDPTRPERKEAIATVEFNFPVDTSSFEKNTVLQLQAIKDDKGDLAAESFKLTITYDEHKRVAYLHSDPLTIAKVARFLVLTIDKGVKSSTGSTETDASITRNLLIPDIDNYFKVSVAAASIVRNEQDRPEQILTIETTLGLSETAINKSLHVYLLPQNLPATSVEAEKINYEWQNPGEVTPAILALSTPVALHSIPADHTYASLHSYQFSAPSPRYLLVKIDKGTRAFGDFALANDYVAVVSVPPFPKEISFLHKGALLALNSEKKLSVLVRGLPAVKFEIARVLPDNINQLVTQTGGDFNNPYFINQSFNQQNISELFSEIQQFDTTDLTKQQYTALDLTRYLSTAVNTQGLQGLFLLQANGWDVANDVPLDVKSTRLILVTNLGMLVKDNNDGSHDVFVQSIVDGVPLPAIEVTVLGKNGLPILTRTTDDQGRVNFPTLKDFVDDRQPTVYIAQNGSDVSFIPFSNYNRQLNFSRFDIGGIYSNQELHSLSAFIFSDRGIYRPGDTAHLGFIVKQAFAQPAGAGFPLEITITDPRGTNVFDQKYTLDPTGFMSVDFSSVATSPTGQYYVNLYTVKDNRAESLLGSTTFRVAEFLPDRMRIHSQLSNPSTKGWISPDNLSAKVSLWNLYGAPAADRRVHGKVLLTPQPLEFATYPGYVFVDPLLDPNKPAKVFTDSLTDVKTNEQGDAEFQLHLDRFDKATYQLIFFAEGFEAEGGRSVTTQSTALVSPLAYFIGFKPDGDLSYIKQNSQRDVHFIAVNPELDQQAVGDLKMQLLSLHPVTTLVKKDNGTYQYQSIIQSTVVSTKPFAIDEQGVNYPLPTDAIGDFALSILSSGNVELSRVKFSIVGASQLPLAKNAELSVKLNKTEFKAGENIELQITAPYTGAGLITIERDKVYSTQWFKTDTTSSVQTIHVPDDFEGDGYVNVAFVRNWDSPDIFISPLSYSVVPFTVNNDNHAVHIELDIPPVATPGEALPIHYYSDKPGKVIVFAVDEGILQVGKYATPDPLGFFFQKHALEVLTQQTVDQILPKYIKDRELSAVGGDDGEELLANHLNPFKRKTDLPVVFWSGIVDTDANLRELIYNVPDYFNGTLRVMAVAVADDAVGATDKKSEIRGHFVINPNVPVFVAPGDTFEITASVANNIKDSGAKALTSVHLEVSPELEVIGSSKDLLAISEGQEQTVRFKLRAKPDLGAAKLTLVATFGDKSSAMNASLSVRPATPFITAVTSGSMTRVTKVLPLLRTLYPEYRQEEAAMSTSPLILVAGLQRYLDNFPYGCTEQLVSKVMPFIAMSKQPWLASDITTMKEKISATVQMLSQRQMSSGGFSYWPTLGDNSNNAFVSVYAMHFLTEARALDYSVPNDLFYAGIGYLKDLAAQNASDFETARLQAYAIYILTRNELVTTNYLTNLQLYLEQDKTHHWKKDITGAYIASSYQLLKSQAEAERLIALYQPQVNASPMSDFYDNTLADAQYLYLIARHFPDRLAASGDQFVNPLVSAINSNEMNTILSSYTSLALGAYAGDSQSMSTQPLSMVETLANNERKTLVASDNTYQKATLDEGTKEVTLNNPEKVRVFYQLTQAGFDKNPPTDAIKQGMEIYRDYRSLDKDIITTTKLGDEILVHIQVRALDNRYINNVAIVDLLPGGFEVVRDSVTADNIDYADVREDRVVFFTSLGSDAKAISYRIKAINSGQFTVPPIIAESMYDPTIKAYTGAAKIMVLAEEKGD